MYVRMAKRYLFREITPTLTKPNKIIVIAQLLNIYTRFFCVHSTQLELLKIWLKIIEPWALIKTIIAHKRQL